jgi:hypothetical protein
MKIRSGLVSNSSTCSFHIYGAIVKDINFNIDTLVAAREANPEKWEELLKHFKYNKKLYPLLKRIHDLDPDEEEVVEDYINGYKENFYSVLFDVTLYRADYEEYIGADPVSMDLDETRRQFEERIDKTVKQLLGEDTVCDYHAEEYSC